VIDCNEWRTETARMRKYGESETTRIMMATIPHVTSRLGLNKFQADGFLLTRVYKCGRGLQAHGPEHSSVQQAHTFWNPTGISYDLKHPSLQAFTSDSENPLDKFYDVEPLSLQQRYIWNSETPLFTARIHPMI